MRKVVVYYSMSGNVDYVAKMIAKKIRADLIRLIPKKEYPSKGFQKFYWGGKSAIMGDMPELENESIFLDIFRLLNLEFRCLYEQFLTSIDSYILKQFLLEPIAILL